MTRHAVADFVGFVLTILALFAGFRPPEWLARWEQTAPFPWEIPVLALILVCLWFGTPVRRPAPVDPR